MEIDYTRIKETPNTVPSSWRPPRHVFFGKRDPNTGTMEEEPVYVHQDYPRMVYKKQGDGLIADIANNEQEYETLAADGFKNSPADFGVVTAPSFEQAKALKAEPVKSEVEPEIKRGPGRPPK